MISRQNFLTSVAGWAATEMPKSSGVLLFNDRAWRDVPKFYLKTSGSSLSDLRLLF